MRSLWGGAAGAATARDAAITGPVLAGLSVAGWTAILRGYGIFDLADEGTILAQALRVAHGERPYVDFHTGYGPLHFVLHGWLVAHGGLGTVRAVLVVVHGATAALVFAATRRLVGGAGAAAAVATAAAFLLPVAPRQGAPFMVPYPAWPAMLATLGCLLLVDRRSGVPSPTRAAAAGVLAGLAFALKANSGLLAAAGGVTAIVLAPGGDRRSGPVALAMLALLALGAVLLVWPPGVGVLWWTFVPPVLVVAWQGRRRTLDDAAAAPAVAAFAGGFAGVAVVAYLPALRALGAADFAREALLVGAPIASVYGMPYPGAALGAVAAGACALRGRPGWAFLLGGAALLAGAASAALEAGSAAAALRLGGERALLVAAALVVWGAAAVLVRGGRLDALAPAGLALTAALQLHPRPDFLHLLAVGPVLTPFAAWLVHRAASPLGRRAPALVAAGVLAVAVVRAAPTAAVAVAVARGRVTTVRVGDARLAIEPGAAARLAAVAAAADAAAARTRPGDRIATFPACALIAFAAQRLPAGRHDYFFPGRPTRDEGAAVAAALAADPPAVAVTCDAAGTDLAAAWAAYPELVALFAERYRPVLDVPPFVVHAVRR